MYRVGQLTDNNTIYSVTDLGARSKTSQKIISHLVTKSSPCNDNNIIYIVVLFRMAPNSSVTLALGLSG